MVLKISVSRSFSFSTNPSLVKNFPLEKFCEETGCKPKTAVEYLAQVIGIRARQTEVVVDWDENDTEIIEDILPSRMGDLFCSL